MAQTNYYNKAKKSGNPTHWIDFRTASKRLHKSLKSARENYISDYLGEAIGENSKLFWSYILKQLKNDDPGVTDLKVDGKIMRDGNLKAELLSNHSSTVSTQEDLSDIPVVGRTDMKPRIGTLTVTVSGVIKQLESLKHLIQMGYLHAYEGKCKVNWPYASGYLSNFCRHWVYPV